ncbi:FKBP-type peptidyl-prolyl cis-trans isomerase [Lysobacter maris]|uniref:Peptidyl-prolyl cis-trans isomerase n=1 Tax=Marilutibacter maris TaxID=1605891 RepID=A0A508AWF7_9GAMM|nr:FKBP-type peptidyl-prolyl cis-trans isomerase [Lysobacter maris]KAB8195012.1 FKBP-type peptidyl-prolyl cis-trans isomerase [Lysobacter maris]
MKALMHGAATLLVSAAAITGVVSPSVAQAQDGTELSSERDKVSYMVGHDVGRSIEPIGPDLDLQAFQRAIENAFAGGEPLLSESEVPAIGQAMMMRSAARAGQAPEGAQIPEVAKDKAGYLVGADIGRSISPIKDEIEVKVLVQAVRAVLYDEPLLLDEAQLGSVRESFSARLKEKAAAKGQANKAEGEKFLAENKAVKGVFTTPSGLQYMVLRQGSGPRPKPTDRVRVNYRGTLLDGTQFDSSYDRGQPAEFALNQVIAGWTEGLGLMPVGSKYKFWIPGDLGYGANGAPGGVIGPNALLVFEVELQTIL